MTKIDREVLKNKFKDREKTREFYIIDSLPRAKMCAKLIRDHTDASLKIKLLEIGRMPDDLILNQIGDLLADKVCFLNGPEKIWAGENEDYPEKREEIQLGDQKFDATFRGCNIEKDELPWDDASFDVVLFCEVLEHLLFDPVHALVEIGRVLRPGGMLILSTPSAVNWMNIQALLRNRTSGDQYSGQGIYARHNREYTPRELKTLLSELGYGIDKFIQLFHPPPTNSRFKKVVCKIASLITRIPIPFLSEKHGNKLIAVARKRQKIRPQYPDWLFRCRFDAKETK